MKKVYLLILKIDKQKFVYSNYKKITEHTDIKLESLNYVFSRKKLNKFENDMFIIERMPVL